MKLTRVYQIFVGIITDHVFLRRFMALPEMCKTIISSTLSQDKIMKNINLVTKKIPHQYYRAMYTFKMLFRKRTNTLMTRNETLYPHYFNRKNNILYMDYIYWCIYIYWCLSYIYISRKSTNIKKIYWEWER